MRSLGIERDAPPDAPLEALHRLLGRQPFVGALFNKLYVQSLLDALTFNRAFETDRKCFREVFQWYRYPKNLYNTLRRKVGGKIHCHAIQSVKLMDLS